MNLVIDPEPLRSKKWWLNYLPQVSVIKPPKNPNETPQSEETKIDTSSKDTQKLEVAWRYQDMLEEKMLGAASGGKAKEIQESQKFRYDNSKPMGDSVSNLTSHALRKDIFLHRLSYD